MHLSFEGENSFDKNCGDVFFPVTELHVSIGTEKKSFAMIFFSRYAHVKIFFIGSSVLWLVSFQIQSIFSQNLSTS